MKRPSVLSRRQIMKPPYADKHVYNAGIICSSTDCNNYVRDDNMLCDECQKRREEELEIELYDREIKSNHVSFDGEEQ